MIKRLLAWLDDKNEAMRRANAQSELSALRDELEMIRRVRDQIDRDEAEAKRRIRAIQNTQTACEA